MSKEKLEYVATLDTTHYEQGTDKIKKGTTDVGKTGTKAFSGIGTSLKSLINPTTLAISGFAAVSGAVVKASADYAKFETKLKEVNTLLKVGKSELDAYGQQFLTLSSKLGVSELDVASGAYQALSAGVGGDDLVNFLEIAGKGAIAGLTDTTTAIEAMNVVINSYKLETSEAASIMDKLITTQNVGVTTVGQLGSALGDVVPIASTLGINIDDLLASIAQLTTQGNTTSKTTTMLKSLFSELAKSGTVASKSFYDLAGVTFPQFIKAGGDITTAMNIMTKGVDGTDKSLIDMFGSIEAGNAALGLSGTNMVKLKEKTDALKNSAGELSEAWVIASDTLSGELGKLWQQLANLGMVTAKPLVESMTEVARQVRYATDGLSNFEEQTQRASSGLEKTNKELEEAQAELKSMEEGTKSFGDILYDGTKAALMSWKVFDKTPQGVKNTITDLQKTKAELESMQATRKELGKIFDANEIAQLDTKKGNIKKYIENNLRLLEIKEKIAKEEARISQASIDGNVGVVNSTATRISGLEAEKKVIEEKIALFEKQKQAMIDAKTVTSTKTEENETTKVADKKPVDITAGMSPEAKAEYERLKAENAEKDKILKQAEEAKKRSLISKKAIQTEEDKFNEEVAQAELTYNEQATQRLINFQAEQQALKSQNQLTEQEAAENKRLFEESEAILDEEFKIAQLEKQRAYLEAQGNMEEEALKLQEDIVARKADLLKKQEAIDKAKAKWDNWASKQQVDIQEASADAVLDVYTALATGQIQSLSDFEEFAKQSIAQLLLQKGQESAVRAIADGALGLSYAAAQMPSRAADAFASAANHAAIAIAFGVGASALSGGDSEGSGSGDSLEENTATHYDENTEALVETSEKSGMVYVEANNSEIMRVLIKEVETALNDEYNVSIVGNKK